MYTVGHTSGWGSVPRLSFLSCVLTLVSCGPPTSPRVVEHIPTPSTAPTPSKEASATSDLAAKVDSIFARYAKSDSPGCAVGVYRAGEVLFAKGYGMANLEHGIPI